MNYAEWSSQVARRAHNPEVVWGRKWVADLDFDSETQVFWALPVRSFPTKDYRRFQISWATWGRLQAELGLPVTDVAEITEEIGRFEQLGSLVVGYFNTVRWMNEIRSRLTHPERSSRYRDYLSALESLQRQHAEAGITPTILDEVGAAISAGEFMPAEVAAQSFPARQRAHKVLVGRAVAALFTEGQPNHEPEGELAELLGW